MALSDWVLAVEDVAGKRGHMIMWDAADAPLHAGGSPVLCARIFRPSSPRHVSIEICVSGTMARVWAAGKNWMDGRAWVDDVYSVEHMRSMICGIDWALFGPADDATEPVPPTP